MVNAPTRPSNRSWSDRRPPRGPRAVALRPTAKDLHTKKQLEAAAATLRGQGKDGMADAIDYTLSPAGWPMLGRLRAGEGTSELGKNLAVLMETALIEHVKAAVEQEPDVDTVTEVVDEAFAKFAAGEFTPRRPVRAAPGMAGPKTNLNVRVNTDKRARAQALLDDPEFIEELGWKPSLGVIARDYLLLKYPLVPYEVDEKPVLPPGSQRMPEVPRAVRDRIREAAKAAGVHVDDVVNEGFQKYLDGRFVPEAPVWTAEERADMVAMKIRPNDGLYEQVKAAGGLRPLQVAVDYLLDEFGIEAGTTE